LNAIRPHIKNGIGYKVGDKHNLRVNNNGKEFIKFTKANSHHVKQDNKASNHASYASNVDANASYMPYHSFDVSYVLIKNKCGTVIALYGGPHHKRPKTCVWVAKVLITNVKGAKQFWVPKTKAWFCYRQKLTGQFGLRSGPRSRWALKTITIE
jgi:hypothetical protein